MKWALTSEPSQTRAKAIESVERAIVCCFCEGLPERVQNEDDTEGTKGEEDSGRLKEK